MNALPPRKATNLSLDAALVDDARALDVNLSRAAEEGLRKAVAAEKGRRWLEENRAAIESSNDYIRKHGLPLAKYRQFSWRNMICMKAMTRTRCSSTSSQTSCPDMKTGSSFRCNGPTSRRLLPSG